MARKVLVTGGSRGIGKAISDRFISEGYSVITPNRDELDLGSEESLNQFLETNKHIYFDVIINNAGINDINLLENVSDSEITNMIAVNLVSPIKLIRAFIPAMREGYYGRIVNIGSIWAVVSKQGRAVYSATKNAMHGITNTLALELAESCILVNTVCPGFTLTELTKKNNDATTMTKIIESIPLKRMAEPNEIAELVYFLGSERNTYITGQKITIDGGYTIQ